MSTLKADKLVIGGARFEPMEVPLDVADITSSVANVDFGLTGINASEVYKLEWANVIGDTDADTFGIRFSTDSGVSYDATAADYDGGAEAADSGGASVIAQNDTTNISVVHPGSYYKDGTYTQTSGYAWIMNANVTGAYTGVVGKSFFPDALASGDDLLRCMFGGFRLSTTAATHVRFLSLGGLMTAGKFKLTGWKQKV